MAIQAQLYSENLGFNGSQDLMDNAFGFNEFCLNFQQQKYMHHEGLQNLQQRSQNLCFENSILFPNINSNSPQPMAISHGVAAQIEKQRQEIDLFISLQNERLRVDLLEQRKQQLASFLKKYESKTEILLRQKDEEMAKAVKRTMNLQDFLRKIEIENQTWQKVAKENEAMVISLNNTIQHLKENASLGINGVEDTESCCDMIKKRGETGENGGNKGDQENEEQSKRKMICKSCNSRSSCDIFLPCRHLCSCKVCEAFLDSCPVCGMVKKASIEVLI